MQNLCSFIFIVIKNKGYKGTKDIRGKQLYDQYCSRVRVTSLLLVRVMFVSTIAPLSFTGEGANLNRWIGMQYF